jgi:hypothetical protein
MNPAAHSIGLYCTLVLLLLLGPATYTGDVCSTVRRVGAESLSVSGSVGVAAGLVCSGSVPWLNSVARVGVMGEDHGLGLGRRLKRKWSGPVSGREDVAVLSITRHG